MNFSKTALLVILGGLFFLSGCIALTYKDCTFNVPVHASMFDMPWLKPSTTPTLGPLPPGK